MQIHIDHLFSLADGDGQSEHLLPVCEDQACQKSAIYLTKLGLDQVLWLLELQRQRKTLCFMNQDSIEK